MFYFIINYATFSRKREIRVNKVTIILISTILFTLDAQLLDK